MARQQKCFPYIGGCGRSSDEAVINAMLAAQGMSRIKPAGLTLRAIDPNRLIHMLERYHPLPGLVDG